MKQRITYLLPVGSNIDPEKIEVSKDQLKLPLSESVAEQKRVTVGLSELPEELNLFLKDCHELHVRWSSPTNLKTNSPIVSRLPAGLHVFFTPRKSDVPVELCPLLHKLFGSELKCHSIEDSFSRPPILSERFSAASSYQYYRPLGSLRHLKAYFQNKLCPRPTDDAKAYAACAVEAAAINTANSVDIDFDLISHAVTITAYWDEDVSVGAQSQDRIVKQQTPQDSIEVGVLQVEKPTEPEELSMGGFLTVIGEDDHPSATLFSFPSRHHPLSNKATFQASLKQPTGLHPTIELSFSEAALLPPSDTCALHAYLTLPSSIFIDRYQLSDKLFLSSQNLESLRSLSGEQDLEAPDWVVKRWGSAALFEMAHPQAQSEYDDEWMVSIPTHLRYIAPSPNTTTPGYETAQMPWPAVFWACEAEEGLKMATNPFDRVNLGYDGLFGPKTMFYHVSPAGENLIASVDVPVMDAEKAEWVQLGTTIVVLIGTVLLGVQLFRAWAGLDKQPAEEKKDQ